MKQAVLKIFSGLEWLLAVSAIYFTTLSFGGINPQAIFLTRLLVLLAFLIHLAHFLLDDHYLNHFSSTLRFPVICFSIFLLLVWFQSFFGLWIFKHSVIGSVNPYLTQRSLVQIMVYAIFFVTCLKIVSERQLLEPLCSSIVVLTFTVSILGMAQKLSVSEKILWKGISPIEGPFFGPFINENHFGGFLGLTFPLAIGLMHYRFGRISREGLKWFQLMNQGVVFLFFLTILTLIACFFSAARVSWLVLLFCCAAYFVTYGMRKRNAGFYFSLVVILASLILILPWMMQGAFAHYFNAETLKHAWNVRSDVMMQSLDLFREYPIFGTGLGTYGVISSKVVSRFINEMWWNHAHNDYIELLTDTGAVGFSLFAGSITSLLLLSVSRIKNRTSLWDKSLIAQAAVAVLCIGAMEFADFHLKIPSIALLFVFQLAVLCGYQDTSLVRFKGRGFKVIVVTAGLALFFWLGIFSIREYRVSVLSQNRDVDYLKNLQRAVEIERSNGELWCLLGKEYLQYAAQFDKKDEHGLELRQEALIALRRATALSPSRSHFWFDLGILEYALKYEREGIYSLEQAVYWSPAMLKYSLYLLTVYLREIERSDTEEIKVQFLKKAEILYRRVQNLEVKPDPGKYQLWMGEYYYKQLQQLVSAWA